MRVVCWWWWVPGCRPQSYCHICLISYLSFCVLAQSLPRCLLLLSPHITCQSIDSYFSYAVPQGSGHTILHAGLKESWSYTNKCKLLSHSTENTLLNLWKDKKNPNIKYLIWVTPTCAKCYDMWEEPGLGWAGPPPGPGPCSYVLTHASCHARVQGPPILTFCPDIFVFLTISPCWWRSHLKQSIIVDILPWGLCSALLVVWTQGSKGAGYQQVTSQFISMLFLVTYRSIS